MILVCQYFNVFVKLYFHKLNFLHFSQNISLTKLLSYTVVYGKVVYQKAESLAKRVTCKRVTHLREVFSEKLFVSLTAI